MGWKNAENCYALAWEFNSKNLIAFPLGTNLRFEGVVFLKLGVLKGDTLPRKGLLVTNQFLHEIVEALH